MRADAGAVRRATIADLGPISRLFDEYRSFQGQPSDLAAATRFLAARLEREESVIFLAAAGESPVGFAQLYPSFSSVSLSRVFILNDLFVTAAARRQGVARALLAALEAHAWRRHASRVTLNVARSNAPAQAAYERVGWVRDRQFLMFHRHAAPPESGRGDGG